MINHTTVKPTNFNSRSIKTERTSQGVTESDVKRIIGKWYVSVDSSSRIAESVSHATKRAYDTIVRINRIWYDMIPVEVVWEKQDPYDSYEDMKQSVESEGKLRVFAGGSKPKHMSHEDNVKGRAVHDWFGHLEADCDFSMKGEWQKFRHVKHRYPRFCRPLLFTEIVAQRAAAGYLPDGFSDELFEQKCVSAPRHIRDFARTAFK